MISLTIPLSTYNTEVGTENPLSQHRIHLLLERYFLFLSTDKFLRDTCARLGIERVSIHSFRSRCLANREQVDANHFSKA